jgi:predicted DNA-binding protein (MmcQ/YjbR family)
LPDTPIDPLLARIRRLCLSLPETSETSSWGHPNFRADKRTFVTFERFGADDSVAFHLTPPEVEQHQTLPGFLRTPYGQGRWVSLKIKPRPKWPLVKALILRSYRLVALKRMIIQLHDSDEPLD